MLKPGIPENEQDRLAALHAMLILDTPPEERFDRIVAFAASEFNAPIALISLVDGDRQWFKGNIGLAVCSTSRDISFCGHAIMKKEIMIVPDTQLDIRFVDNPLVTGDPQIRFYAGAPLETQSGFAIGTLCIIDTVPRQFDSIDLAILSSLRDLVMLELTNSGAISDE